MFFIILIKSTQQLNSQTVSCDVQIKAFQSESIIIYIISSRHITILYRRVSSLKSKNKKKTNPKQYFQKLEFRRYARNVYKIYTIDKRIAFFFRIIPLLYLTLSPNAPSSIVYTVDPL